MISAAVVQARLFWKGEIDEDAAAEQHRDPQ
jgi:hypothetical protein